ncbi:plastidic glucose transporter 4 [Iris pallida]|uniref:Plastidic glucose transporter 4 n=1 Tax=Iris pallida TaxID=29817 RepID=A0AAX6H465_IRIPA|nr:plastidic glucose transporter 4 [Iris pallida]
MLYKWLLLIYVVLCYATTTFLLPMRLEDLQIIYTYSYICPTIGGEQSLVSRLLPLFYWYLGCHFLLKVPAGSFRFRIQIMELLAHL